MAIEEFLQQAGSFTAPHQLFKKVESDFDCTNIVKSKVKY